MNIYFGFLSLSKDVRIRGYFSKPEGVGEQNTWNADFYYCTVHFDNIKILFTKKCTLY
jgi:hypothetical protein